METDPGEGEDDPQTPQNQAVQLHHPPERGEAGTVELEDEALLPFPGRGAVVIQLLLSLVTDRRIF